MESQELNDAEKLENRLILANESARIASLGNQQSSKNQKQQKGKTEDPYVIMDAKKVYLKNIKTGIASNWAGVKTDVEITQTKNDEAIKDLQSTEDAINSVNDQGINMGVGGTLYALGKIAKVAVSEEIALFGIIGAHRLTIMASEIESVKDKLKDNGQGLVTITTSITIPQTRDRPLQRIVTLDFYSTNGKLLGSVLSY